MKFFRTELHYYHKLFSKELGLVLYLISIIPFLIVFILARVPQDIALIIKANIKFKKLNQDIYFLSDSYNSLHTECFLLLPSKEFLYLRVNTQSQLKVKKLGKLGKNFLTQDFFKLHYFLNMIKNPITKDELIKKFNYNDLSELKEEVEKNECLKEKDFLENLIPASMIVKKMKI